LHRDRRLKSILQMIMTFSTRIRYKLFYIFASSKCAGPVLKTHDLQTNHGKCRKISMSFHTTNII
jgi:hypothetical protein